MLKPDQTVKLNTEVKVKINGSITNTGTEEIQAKRLRFVAFF